MRHRKLAAGVLGRRATRFTPAAAVASLIVLWTFPLMSALAMPATATQPDAKQPPAPDPTPQPTLTIEQPGSAQSALKRTARIRGRAPRPPRGGGTLTTVAVNGRHVAVSDEDGGGFTVRAALDVGVNTITATAEIYTADDEMFEHPQTVASSPVSLTRELGPDTGELDLATALLVAEDHSDVYWLCGEADACVATEAGWV